MRRPHLNARRPLAEGCFSFVGVFFGESALAALKNRFRDLTSALANISQVVGDEAVMSNEAELKEVMELLHELKLELVAEMDYASLELQVEAIIDKVYTLTETSE